MFRAIGLLIVIWGLSHFFNSAFVAFDSAMTEVFKFVEVSAVSAQNHVQ